MTETDPAAADPNTKAPGEAVPQGHDQETLVRVPNTSWHGSQLGDTCPRCGGRSIQKGDRIRLVSPTVSGFRGLAVVLCDAPEADPDDLIYWRPLESTDTAEVGVALRREVVRCRDQRQGVARG